jgi:hypothetical protein
MGVNRLTESSRNIAAVCGWVNQQGASGIQATVGEYPWLGKGGVRVNKQGLEQLYMNLYVCDHQCSRPGVPRRGGPHRPVRDHTK